MALQRVVRSSIVDAPIERVWEILRDFNSHDQWHSVVAQSEIEDQKTSDRVGCVRNFTLADGNHIREMLISLSDKDHVSTYTIVEATVPLMRYVATVTLNRPHRKNAMTPTMWEELLVVFAEVEANAADRVLVITGAEDAFCSGADLTDASGSDSAATGVGASVERMRLVNRCALTLHELHTPTLAAVNGVAAGAGLNLALGCDIVIASDRARFSEIFSTAGNSRPVIARASARITGSTFRAFLRIPAMT